MDSGRKLAHCDIPVYGRTTVLHVSSSARTAPTLFAAGLQAYGMGISVDAGRHRQTSTDALPERRVTVHTGDMGYTIGPFAGSAKCPGRRVNPWTSVSSSSPA